MTRFALEKDRITAVALVAILIAGISAYLGMSRAEDPGFPIRVAVVQTLYPGASPERVELLITDKLEKTIQEIPELDFVSSQSKTGVSIIHVSLRDDVPGHALQEVWDLLRRKVEKATPDLPDGVIGPTVNDEFGDVFGTVIGITGDGFSYAELDDVADFVRDELLLIDSVAKVEIYGRQDKRIFLEYNNARLAELGLSPAQLQVLLEAQNVIIPGGEVRTEFERIALEPTGNFESVDEIRYSVIRLPSGELSFLQDIAELREGYIDPPSTIMRTNGEQSLGLAISMRDGANIIELGEAVRGAVRRLESFYPIGLEFTLIQAQADAVEKKVSEFVGNLVQAIALVAIVMLVSLGFRTGLVVASLIPMAMVMALLVMSFFGIGLDQMSLASLIIALGMLVDNAIVMSEAILVRMERGTAAKTAALEAASELRVPLLTSSLTTAAAFLPIFLAESDAGEYTAALFKVVTITLLCSWILSLTMIPLLCVRYLRVEVQAEEDPFSGRGYQLYDRLLRFALKHRAWVLTAVALTFASALYAGRFLPNIFFPANDRPTFTAELELPVGSPIQRTETVVEELESWMRGSVLATDDRPGVTTWASFIGQGAPRFVLGYSPEMSSPEYAILIMNASTREAVDPLAAEIEQHILRNFPDVNPTVRPLESGPPAWPPVAVRLSARDPERLTQMVEATKDRLASTAGARQISDNWGPRAKKLVVRVNQARAQRAGVTSQDIAISLQSFLSGFTTTEFRDGDELVPVVLRSAGSVRDDLGRLESINVYTLSTGASVPLKQVADIEIVWQPAKVLRRNRVRTVTVESGLEPGFTASQVNAELKPWLEAQEAVWGPGTLWSFGGEAETSGKASASIAEKLPIAGVIIALLLVGQFNSLRRPAIILLTIPLGMIGVIYGLLFARSYFGFMTLLGVISLSGIVINNAIVLLDRIRLEIEENGLAPYPAILEAARQRLRPILLTTVTTIGGLVPLWLGGGAMWEPMAVAIIFGLMFATLLTLGVVPVLYSLFFRVRL